MRSIRLYYPDTLTVGSTVSLDEDTLRYLGKVLRLREGDNLLLFNGDGWEYHAHIESIKRRALSVVINTRKQNERESPIELTLCLALLKGEAMDWSIQKAVELGVSHIIPYTCTRVERRLSEERVEKRRNHWQKIVIGALQQCGRTHLPTLSDPLTYQEILNTTAEHRVILSPHHRTTSAQPSAPASIALLIGPEGGFTEEEVATAQANHWTSLLLGPRVLRADTAVVAALTALQYRYGDMKCA